MGESWMLLWILSFAGLFIIVVSLCDYADRKKRNQEIKVWKYLLAIVVGLLFMFPVISSIVIHLPRLLGRRWP